MNLKNLISLLFSIIISSNIFGQSNLDKKIKIDVHIIGLQDNEKYFLNSNNKAGIDSALVNGETFSLLYDGEPNTFIISTKPDMGSDGSNKLLAMFISGESDITIRGHVDSLQNIRISGSKVHDEIWSFNQNIIMPLVIAKNSIPYSELEKRDSIEKKINISFTTFIEEHSNKYSGLLMFYQRILNKAYTAEEAKKLLTLFENKHKDSYYFKTCLELLNNAKQVKLGKQAPNFSSRDLDNKIITLNDYRGKYVLLEFWSSWCGPCIYEMPILVKAYEKYKNEGFEIIGISLDTNRDTWKRKIKEKNLAWTQISDLKGTQNEIAMLYYVSSIPQSFLLNPEGIIIEINLRDSQLTKKLEEIFKK